MSKLGTIKEIFSLYILKRKFYVSTICYRKQTWIT